MSLESLLKPIKYVDEEVLRYHTKLTTKWEDMGGNKYVLAQIASTPSWFLILGSNIPINFKNLLAYLLSTDSAVNILGMINPKIVEKEPTSDYVTRNSFIYVTEKIRESTRLPMFAIGTGLVIKSGFSFYNHFINNELILEEGLSDLSFGIGLLGISSSEYIKDSNPKLLDKELLDKEPSWKKVYGLAKEKLSLLSPEPTPEPVPIQPYISLFD